MSTTVVITDTFPSKSKLVYKSSAVWATARSAAAADAVDASIQAGAIAAYVIYRSGLIFDTSGIPSTAVVSAAKLQMYVQTLLNVGGGTHNVRITNGQPTYPHDPIVVGDYDMTNYAGGGGDHDFRLDGTGAYIDWPLNATGISWLNLGGSTKFFLRNVERDINDSAPGNDQKVYFTDGTAGKEPKLEITYTLSAAREPIMKRPLIQSPTRVRPLG